MPVDSTARGMAAAALAALTGGTSALSASSLALGGATIGTNALAVTGTTLLGGVVTFSPSGTYDISGLRYLFLSGGLFFSGSSSLTFDSPYQLAQVNGTNANTFRVYNTSSSANANYERGVFGWTDTANVLTIGTQNAGTGTARKVKLIGAGILTDTTILPTTDPHVAGQLWANSGIVTVSAG